MLRKVSCINGGPIVHYTPERKTIRCAFKGENRSYKPNLIRSAVAVAFRLYFGHFRAVCG